MLTVSSFKLLWVHPCQDLTWTHYTDTITNSKRQNLIPLSWFKLCIDKWVYTQAIAPSGCDSTGFVSFHCCSVVLGQVQQKEVCTSFKRQCCTTSFSLFIQRTHCPCLGKILLKACAQIFHNTYYIILYYIIKDTHCFTRVPLCCQTGNTRSCLFTYRTVLCRASTHCMNLFLLVTFVESN